LFLSGAGAEIWKYDRSTCSLLANNTGNNQAKAAFVYGGGVDFDISKFLALRAEYRGYVYKIPDFQLPGLASDNFTHLAQPSIGLVWRF